MAGRKRTTHQSQLWQRSDTSSSSSSDADPSSSKRAKRQVTVATFEKWQRDFDRLHQTRTWLRCDRSQDRSLVDLLWCDVCRKYEDSIRGMKNFQAAWTAGSTNQRTSNVLDHAASDQHKAAMTRRYADQAKADNRPITSYAPIARGLLTLEDSVKATMKLKFDICYLIAREGMAFEKYPPLYELQTRHGVNLGSAYKSPQSAKTFTHYIAAAQREALMVALANTPFFSFLMDGSTDSGNLEQELVVVLFCQKDDSTEEIRSYARFLCVATPEKADANGLIKCLSHSLHPLGIEDVLNQDNVLSVQGKPILVGGGTDGASVNISRQNGMKGNIEGALPWVVWSWCYAHRLELACKDGIKSRLFKDIEQLLLRLYYLYEKSPKKTRELEGIVEDLKEVFELPRGGNMPVRSHGSRWITHKRKVLQRVVDRFGAYVNHLATLADDRALRVEDRARIKGYVGKWVQYKCILGCAMYVDLLKPPSLLSLSLQGCQLDIVLGIKNILKASAALKTLARQDPLEWPTAKLVEERIQEEGSEKMYQGATLKNVTLTAKENVKEEVLRDLGRLNDSMRERLEWSDITLLRSLLVFIETQNWAERSRNPNDSDEGIEDCSLAEVKKSVELLTSHFRKPLEAKGVTIATIQDEIEDIVDYARKYIDINSSLYRKVWYKLQSCPDASKWPNVIALSQLAFSLPFSNGRVEQIFSALKILKPARRTNLHTDTLNDLLEIYVEGVPLSSFSADRAVELWWSDCNTSRRPNQQSRKPYHSHNTESIDEEQQEGEHPTLDDWDELFCDD